MNGAGFHLVFLAADDHIQFSFYNIGDLFVDMVVFGKGTTFFDIPNRQGAAVAVEHFSEKARNWLFYRDIAQVLHVGNFFEGTPKGG